MKLGVTTIASVSTLAAIALAVPAAATEPTEIGGPSAQVTAADDAPGDYVGTNINIRSTPNGDIIGVGNQGDGLTSDCSMLWDGVEWYHHRNNRTGQVGWSHGHYVDTQWFPPASCS